MYCPAAQVPSCSALQSWRTTSLSQRCRPQRCCRHRRPFRCQAKQETSTAQSKSKSPSDRTEQQADSEAKQVVKEAEDAGDSAKAEKVDGEVRVTKGSGQKIYLGFQKGDTDRSKPGRMIDDDPSKYPDRTSTVGGWAGGEKGLQDFIRREQEEMSANKAVVQKQDDKEKEGKKPKVMKQDGDTIYIGYAKDDYEGKRAGEGGRTITGDVEQYPSRTSLTGGFAGGEAGLQQFLEEGEVKFKDPNEGCMTKQVLLFHTLISISRPFNTVKVIMLCVIGVIGNGNFNILAFAGLLAIATTVGGVLLTDAIDVGEFQFKGASEQLQQLTSKPTDDNSKLLLLVVGGLFGVTATGVAVRTAFRSVAGKVTRGSLQVAKLAIFWAGVFVAARFILESN